MRRRTPEDIVSGILAKSDGLRARVDAQCVSCIYDDHVRGAWRQQVEACTVTTCPLYPVRPVSYRKQACKGDPEVNYTSVPCEIPPKTGNTEG